VALATELAEGPERRMLCEAARATIDDLEPYLAEE
jgi:hypothetical protein